MEPPALLGVPPALSMATIDSRGVTYAMTLDVLRSPDAISTRPRLSGGRQPDSPAGLPRAVHAGSGTLHTIQTMLLIATPIAAVAFAVSWFLPDIEMCQTLPTDEPH